MSVSNLEGKPAEWMVDAGGDESCAGDPTVVEAHEEIVGFREAWQAQLSGDQLFDGPFGRPVGESLGPIPAPELPGIRLEERR